MPERVLDAIDRYAKANGETRSGLLARAAARYIGREAGALPQAKPTGATLPSLRNGAKTATPSGIEPGLA